MALRMPAIHMRWARKDKYLWCSLLAEFVGTALYQLLASVTADSPLESAFTFGALLYATKYISGGHLNPAVSLAATLSGHIDVFRGGLYILSQFLGAISGAMVQAWMSPDSAFGQAGPGCFMPVKALNNWNLVGWETLMTFLFIVVAYQSIFVRPGHGDASPLAAALALFAALSTGGVFTGMSPLNPARSFAGALVFKCWRWVFVYISAHATASLLAAGWALLMYGRGPFYQRGSASESLREGLLGNEPMGPVGTSTFAPTGFHYAGSQAYAPEHDRPAASENA